MHLCPQFIFILFHDRGWQGGVFKVINNDHFLVFLTVWVLFPIFFRQVKAQLILELYEMIRVSHVVAGPICFFVL